MVSHTIEYSDGRRETVELPSTYQAGDVIAVTRKKDGSVVAQRVSPIGVTASLVIICRQSGLTEGATSQVRYIAKVDRTIPVTGNNFFYPRYGWHYSQAYDEHYSSDYDAPTDGSEFTTDWAQYTMPEFVVPYGGGLFVSFEFYPYNTPKNRFPIYIDEPEILIGSTWTPLPAWSWLSLPINWDYNSSTSAGWWEDPRVPGLDGDISSGYLVISTV